ncbi:MAG: ferredoxin family protein [Planctomycetota bacterium]
MSYVVGEPCIGCKYGDCVTDCPVDCFFQVDEMLVINPDECIDCGQCLPLCPVDAIFVEGEGPRDPSLYRRRTPQAYVELAREHAFPEAARVTDKSQVNHGPDRDPRLIQGL